MAKKKLQFDKVYYIVQVVPLFKICGHTFDPKEAKALSKLVHRETGLAGRVIEFSRENLEELGYAQR